MQDDARNDTAKLVKNVISRDRIRQKFTIFKNSQFEKFRIEKNRASLQKKSREMRSFTGYYLTFLAPLLVSKQVIYSYSSIFSSCLLKPLIKFNFRF